MSMFHSSRHTLTANVIQQLCAGLLLIFLPNILGKEDYAQVVFVAVLLSFMEFADMGISRVYGRVVPPLLVHNKHDEIRAWDSSALSFALMTSSLYSVIVTMIYYHRYGDLTNALLFLPVPFIMAWFSFYISHSTVRSDFKKYLKANSWRAVVSLTALPLVFTFGVIGFFISNLMAAVAALVSFGRQILSPFSKPDWVMVRSHLGEGILISLTSVLFMNLMNFARFYASISYQAGDIATYGIISAAWMSLLSLLVSILIPVNVEMRLQHGRSEEHALIYANKIIRKSLPWVIVATLITIICIPYVFKIIFPSYHFDQHVLSIIFLGVTFYLFLTVYANLVVIRKRFKLYLAAIIASSLASVITSFMVDMYYPTMGAAWGQLAGIMAATLSLLWTISDFPDTACKVLLKEQNKYLLCAFVFSVAVISAVFVL